METDKTKLVTLDVRERQTNMEMITMPEGVIIQNKNLRTQYVALDDVDADEAIRLLCQRRGYASPVPTPEPVEEPFVPQAAPDVVLGEEYIDLPRMIDIDDFDMVVRAVEGVVEQSSSLALDNAEDRKVLIARVLKSLGCVVDEPELRL